MDEKIIYDLLKEVRADQKRHSEELAKQSSYLDKMDRDLERLKDVTEKNTKDIEEHIRRTDLLEDLHKLNEGKIELNNQRLAILEEPVKAKAWIKKNLLSLSSTAAALSAIAALIAKIKGLW